jgi:hypothetical protein
MIVNLVTNTWHIVKKVHNVSKTFVIIIVNVLFISAINYLPQVFWVYFRKLPPKMKKNLS